MNIRQQIKYFLYSYVPGFAEKFPYFGTQVHFTRGSRIFRAACEQGIFEASNVHVLRHLVRPNTWMFDVGCNIGLMSIPVLSAVSGCRVLAFEPSQNVLAVLQRTIAGSPFGDRWRLVAKAVGDHIGTTSFCLSSQENSAFDGLQSTQRVAAVAQAQVEITTLDYEWERLGRPEVAVIKCDVEGAELAVLTGARKLVEACKPAILLEWNAENLQAYGCAPSTLLNWAEALCYDVFALPHMITVQNLRQLTLQMLATENFLLLPRVERVVPADSLVNESQETFPAQGV